MVEPDGQKVTILFAFLSHVKGGALGFVAVNIFPINRLHDPGDLIRCVTAGVQSADHTADAGTHDQIHRDVVFFQRLQHANVKHAARAAAAQHQSHAGSVRLGIVGAVDDFIAGQFYLSGKHHLLGEYTRGQGKQ